LSSNGILDVARRWIEERDVVVMRDRIATSVFAGPGAERPSHDKFLKPLNACADMLQRLLPADMSPADWAALSELVQTVAARMVQANPDSLARNSSRLAGPTPERVPIDPDNPETWDV
jgi:hypothetical protein